MGFWNNVANLFRRKKKETEKQDSKRLVKFETEPETQQENKPFRQQNKPRQRQKPIVPVKTIETEIIPTDTHKTNRRLVKDEERKIDGDIINSYQFSISPSTMYEGRMSSEMQYRYNRLLGNKIEDDKLKDDIVKNESISAILIKKRVAMIIKVMDMHNFGEFEVIGILPEDEEAIQSFWLGREIDSNGWQQALMDFEIMMEQRMKPILAVKSIQTPINRFKVTNIEGTTTFK